MNVKDSVKFTGLNEGYRQFPYTCTAGKLTVGHGLNLDDVGLSVDESEMILRSRLTKIDGLLFKKFSWYLMLDNVRKIAMCDMAYQMGFNGLCGFKKSLRFMADGAYTEAAKEFADSRWHSQTPIRADRICKMIESGKW